MIKYPVLYSELTKSKYDINKICENLQNNDLNLSLLMGIIIGEEPPTLNDAVVIKTVIGSDLSIEDLFKESE